jgi:transposase, IS30 family
MGSKYSALSMEERVQMQLLRDQGLSCRAIALQLKRATSSITREFARNMGLLGHYVAASAQHRCRARRNQAKAATRKLGPRMCSPLGVHVRQQLAAWQSPRQIAGRLRAMPDPGLGTISPESIYRAIYVLTRGDLRSALVACLRRAHSKRMPRARGQARASLLPNIVSIDQRPREADSREVPGHWETDLIKGSFNRSAVGTLIERHSRFVLLARMQGCTAEDALQAFSKRLSTVPAALRKTMAYDRGSEMALHEQLSARTGIEVFFCDPRSPWQRACNENLNGLVRQYLPKGMDLSGVSHQELFHIQESLNNRPRAILGFKTPNEVYKEILEKLNKPIPAPFLHPNSSDIHSVALQG